MRTKLPVCPNCERELSSLDYYEGLFRCPYCSCCLGNTQEGANEVLKLVEEPEYRVERSGLLAGELGAGTEVIEISEEQALNFVKNNQSKVGWRLLRSPHACTWVGVIFPMSADSIEELYRRTKAQ